MSQAANMTYMLLRLIAAVTSMKIASTSSPPSSNPALR